MTSVGGAIAQTGSAIKEAAKSSDIAWTTVCQAAALRSTQRFRSGSSGDRNRLTIGRRTMLRRIDVDIEGHDNHVIIGSGSSLREVHIEIRGSGNRIVVGDRVFAGPLTLWAEDDGGTIEVGDDTTIESAQLITLEGSTVTVGRDCMFAHHVQVRTGDSHPIFDDASGERINLSRSIAIGEHVWLGLGATVLKGVTLPAGTVVGAQAVVTHSVEEERTVVAGNPARAVRRNVRWTR